MSKLFSLIIALIYLILSFILGGLSGFLKILVFLIFPLGCIWFSDDIGNYTGFSGGFRPTITQKTPGCLISLFGWILLIMPLIVGIIYFIIE